MVTAIAWLLNCDMKGRPRPGHAPLGKVSLGFLMADLVANDLDGRLTKALVPEGGSEVTGIEVQDLRGCDMDSWRPCVHMQGREERSTPGAFSQGLPDPLLVAFGC